jgi:glyoxylase-like metal-dependent hydrolase (beta-lactamase superfamily II)
LRKIRRIARICPAHGDVIEDPHARLDEYMKHRRMRERQIVKLLGEGPTKISDVVARLYTETPEGLKDMAGRQVHAHLLKLRAEGKVAGTGVRSAWKLA